jgi:glucose-1-phosphate thymidylyltransferase
MIHYPIQMLVDAGIEEIMIVTGGNSAGDFLRLIGNGKEFGVYIRRNQMEYELLKGWWLRRRESQSPAAGQPDGRCT